MNERSGDNADRSPTAELTDAIVLDRFSAGEATAANTLYERYASRVLRLAQRRVGRQLGTRIDADDIVQSVFRTFFRRAAEGHYQIPEGDELWKLLLVIALNKLRKKVVYHRAAKRNVDRTHSIGEHQISSETTPIEVLKLTIEDLLVTMPEQYQQIIKDRIVGFEIADLAQRNGTSKRTVERVLQTFRKRLQSELQDSQHE